MTIINRAGKVIYQSDNYQNDWSAAGVTSGTYYYYLKNDFYNLEYRGYVQVIK